MIENKTRALVKEGIFHKLHVDYNMSLIKGREQMKRASTPLLQGSNSAMMSLNKKKLIMSKIHIDDSKVSCQSQVCALFYSSFALIRT